MNSFALVLDFGLGALIGAFGGLFGVGGGVIAVPVLALLYGLDQQHAQGTAMAMVVPNVLLGLRRYRQKATMDNRMALTLAASAVVFTLPFALLARCSRCGDSEVALRAALAPRAFRFDWRRGRLRGHDVHHSAIRRRGALRRRLEQRSHQQPVA
jgi:uncharacterized protein